MEISHKNILHKEVNLLILLNLNPEVIIVLILCVIKWEVHVKWFYDGKNSHAIKLPIWTSFLVHGKPFLVVRMYWQTMALHTWIFVRHFLENGWKWAYWLKENNWQKLLPVIKYEWKLEFWKILSTILSLAASWYYWWNHSDINKNDIFIVHNEVNQHWEDLPDSANQHFSYDQCMMLKKHAYIKEPNCKTDQWILM